MGHDISIELVGGPRDGERRTLQKLVRTIRFRIPESRDVHYHLRGRRQLFTNPPVYYDYAPEPRT
jgi:hypothetical protein